GGAIGERQDERRRGAGAEQQLAPRARRSAGWLVGFRGECRGVNDRIRHPACKMLPLCPMRKLAPRRLQAVFNAAYLVMKALMLVCPVVKLLGRAVEISDFSAATVC